MASLKALRNQLGLSQPAFADLLRCSTGQLSMAESGLRSLPAASLALATALAKILATIPVAARQADNAPQEKTRTLLYKHIHRCQVQMETLEITALKLQKKLQAARQLLSLPGFPDTLPSITDMGEVKLQITILQRKAGKKIQQYEEKLIRLQLSVAGLQGEIAKAKELTILELK